VIPIAFVLAGGHGGFFGNATGNNTLDSNFTGISGEAQGVSRVIEQYIGAYAVNTLGKTQKVFSRKIRLTECWHGTIFNLTKYESMIAHDHNKIQTNGTCYFAGKKVSHDFNFGHKSFENITVCNF